MDEAPRITTAGRSHSDDVWTREKRYLITMAIRSVCFLLTAIFAISGPKWLALVFAPAAILLPYVAVIVANAGASPDPTRAQLYDVPRKALPAPEADHTDEGEGDSASDS